ncbi:tetratricopeptide repeat protein [Arthrobacter monumenti]
MLTQELLDILWDFSDPAGSEDRLRRALLSGRYDDVEQAELATQIARALGRQGLFDEAKEVLDEVSESPASQEPVVWARVLLERGRILNSYGHKTLATTLFERAANHTALHHLIFLGVDALHMLAIADPAHAEGWTLKALDLADNAQDPRTAQWSISLHNNLGWHFDDAGDHWAALHHFRLAKIASDECGTDAQKHIAQWTVGRCLRAMGRYEDALEIQEELDANDPEDPYVKDELNELLRAMADSDSEGGAGA